MTRHRDGLLVACRNNNASGGVESSTAEFARLFDMLVSHFRYVVVDASTRYRMLRGLGSWGTCQKLGGAGGPC